MLIQRNNLFSYKIYEWFVCQFPNRLILVISFRILQNQLLTNRYYVNKRTGLFAVSKMIFIHESDRMIFQSILIQRAQCLKIPDSPCGHWPLNVPSLCDANLPCETTNNRRHSATDCCLLYAGAPVSLKSKEWHWNELHLKFYAKLRLSTTFSRNSICNEFGRASQSYFNFCTRSASNGIALAFDWNARQKGSKISLAQWESCVRARVKHWI